MTVQPGDIVRTIPTAAGTQDGVAVRNVSGKTEWLVAAAIGIGAFETEDLTVLHPAGSEEATEFLAGLQYQALSWDVPGAQQVLALVLNQLD